MATGTGLDAQLVFGQESAWGTENTAPTRALEFDSESLKFDPTFLEPTGLRAGRKFKRASRVRVSRTAVTGDVVVELATLGMGMLVRNMLGSVTSTTTALTSPATQQVHQPGGFFGMGLTCQVGRPQPIDGVVKPFTYYGLKVTDWELDLKDNAVPTLKLTFDGKGEDTTTALVTPSYLAGSTVFDFSQSTLKLGGTAATTSGVVAITGGTAVATTVTEFKLTGKSGFANQRYGVGNSGLKSEQLENATPTITGTLNAEFNKAELYDVFKANTSVALQFTLTGAAIGASGSNNKFDVVIPVVKFKSAPPNVSGPGIVAMNVGFEMYDDETNAQIQVTITSADTAV